MLPTLKNLRQFILFNLILATGSSSFAAASGQCIELFIKPMSAFEIFQQQKRDVGNLYKQWVSIEGQGTPLEVASVFSPKPERSDGTLEQIGVSFPDNSLVRFRFTVPESRVDDVLTIETMSVIDKRSTGDYTSADVAITRAHKNAGTSIHTYRVEEEGGAYIRVLLSMTYHKNGFQFDFTPGLKSATVTDVVLDLENKTLRVLYIDGHEVAHRLVKNAAGDIIPSPLGAAKKMSREDVSDSLATMEILGLNH